MTTDVNGVSVSDPEKTVAVSINKTPNNRKHLYLCRCLQRFDALGLAAGRASSL